MIPTIDQAVKELQEYLESATHLIAKRIYDNLVDGKTVIIEDRFTNQITVKEFKYTASRWDFDFVDDKGYRRGAKVYDIGNIIITL
jgi:hypothetical protein